MVDLARALRATAEGQRATAELRAMFDARQAALDREQAALRNERTQLDNALAAGMARGEYDRRVADYTRRFTNLQRTFQDFQAEINRRESQLTERIRLGLETAARAVAIARSIALIVDSGSLVARNPQSAPPPDVTDDVVRAYDVEHPSPRTPP